MRAALAEELPVHAIPGASAPLTALVLAGLPTDRFLFAGFLPREAGRTPRHAGGIEGRARHAGVLRIRRSAWPKASPIMAAVLGPRAAAVGRELTKLP